MLIPKLWKTIFFPKFWKSHANLTASNIIYILFNRRNSNTIMIIERLTSRS